jgi:hypothetical protein
MEITLAKIQEALKTDANLRKDLVVTLSETDEGKELLGNHAKAYYEANIGSKVSEIYKNIDEDIFSVLGVRKKSDQKTYDFLKTEILAEYKKIKDSNGTDSDKEQKIKELETQLESFKNNNSDLWKRTHEEAVKEWNQEKQNWQNKISELETRNLNYIVENDLSMGMAGLKINPTIPKSVVDTYVESVKREVLKSAKVDDGKVIYLKEDGTTWHDKEYKPITAKGIFAEKLKEILDTGVPAVGGGAPKGKAGEIVTVGSGSDATKKVVLDQTKFNTRLSFMETLETTLIEQGVSKNSEEWAELRDTAYEEYKVAELPRV